MKFLKMIPAAIGVILCLLMVVKIIPFSVLPIVCVLVILMAGINIYDFYKKGEKGNMAVSIVIGIVAAILTVIELVVKSR